MDKRQGIEGVVRALRRVNFQGSIFGQTIAIRLGLSESDIDALELLIDTGAATAGKLSEVMGLTSGAVTRVVDRLEQAGYVRRVTDPADRRTGRHRGRPGARGDHRVTARFARTGGRRRGRPLLPGAAGDDQRLPFADGRPDPGRVGPPANPDRGRRLRADRPGRALSAAGRPLERAPDVPLGRAGAAAPVRPLGRGALPRPLRRGDAAGPVRDGRVLVQYRGIPFDWRKRVATIGLNPSIPWSLEAVGGVTRVEADLREIDVRRFDLIGGSERIQAELGQPTGDVPIRIVGGAKTIRLERPAGVPVRVRVMGEVGQVEVDRQSYGSKSGDTSVERAAGATRATGSRSRWSAASRP